MIKKEDFNVIAVLNYRLNNTGKVCYDLWDTFKTVEQAIEWANEQPKDEDCYKDLEIRMEMM